MRFAVVFLVLAAFRQPARAQSYDALFQEAASLSARGDYASAIEKFQAALRLRPDAPEALSNLGLMYHQARQYREAVDTMALVVKTNPDLLPVRLVLGLDLIRLNRPQEAIPHLLAARKLSPQNAEAALGLAAAYVAVNRLQQAADVYEELTRATPRNADPWYGLGLCYERMAESASRRLSRAPGGGSLEKKLLTEFLLDRGEVRLAEEAMREATAPKLQDPSQEALRAYDEARRLAGRSRDAFLKLIEIAPEAWQSRLFLADLHRQQRKFPEAIAAYEAAERAIPESPGPKLGLATVHWELGQFEDAERYLRQVLDLQPSTPQALFELGNIRVRQHRDGEAIPLLRAFLANDPDSLSACADLGRAYFHLGRNQEAAAYLERARSIDEKGEIHYQLATALERLGRSADAAAARRTSKILRARDFERQQRLKGRAAPENDGADSR